MIKHKNDVIGDDFIGQHNLRVTINFLVSSFEHTRFFDNVLFVAKRGDGKTLICRKIAKALGKKTIEINGSSLSSITALVDQIINPHVSGNQDVTLFIDEVASVNPKVLDWLLSVLQYDPHTKLSSATHDGVTHNFNFRHLTVLTATTNPEKLPEPFKSRFRRLEFAPYTKDELIKILLRYTPGLEIEAGVLEEIASVSRDSPRHITLHLAEDIKKLSAQKSSDNHIFSADDWRLLKDILSISEMGLTPNEIRLLEILSGEACTLTCLTGKFCMDAATLRREIELYPFSHSLFTISGKRHITPKGVEVLERIRRKNKPVALDIEPSSIAVIA